MCVSHTGCIEHFYPLRSTSFCKWPFLLLLSSRRQILIKLHQEKSLFYTYITFSFIQPGAFEARLQREKRGKRWKRKADDEHPPTSAKKRGERLGKTSFPRMQIKEKGGRSHFSRAGPRRITIFGGEHCPLNFVGRFLLFCLWYGSKFCSHNMPVPVKHENKVVPRR